MTEKNSFIVRIAGAAGDGIASTGEVFGKTCSRSGLHVMAYNAYQSAIRGGHVWLQLNVGSEKQLSHGEEPDVVLLLNKTSPWLHVPQVKSGGVVFYNAATITEDISHMRDDVTFYPIDYKKELGDENVSPVMANVLLVGAMMEAVGLDTSYSLDFIKEKFSKKGDEIVNLNQKVLNTGVEWSKANVKPLGFNAKGDGKKRMFMTGNDAFGMGLMAHGLKFYCAYPMSPSTGVLHYLARYAQSDKVVVKQAEDEIAVINYVIGAAHAGVRAACATSGGGFALMVEALGLAGMIEDPIVVINVQRGGPSTGVPTKQEQADINLVMGGSGDFPKIVLAPKDTEDAFYISGRALNLAEKYQVPVIILSDTYLSEHYETVDPVDFNRIAIERGKVVPPEEATTDYLRYKYTEDGISPKLYPGAPKGMYCSASDEHTERGHIITDVLAGLPDSLEVRNKMHAKRMQKEVTMREQDMQPPELVGSSSAKLTLMSWGSTYNMVQEAIELLKAEGIEANNLHFTDLYPMPNEKVLEMLESCDEIIAVENNMTNQMCSLISRETGFRIKQSVNRYDGEPFTGEYIRDAVKKLVKAPVAA